MILHIYKEFTKLYKPKMDKYNKIVQFKYYSRSEHKRFFIHNNYDWEIVTVLQHKTRENELIIQNRYIEIFDENNLNNQDPDGYCDINELYYDQELQKHSNQFQIIAQLISIHSFEKYMSNTNMSIDIINIISNFMFSDMCVQSNRTYTHYLDVINMKNSQQYIWKSLAPCFRIHLNSDLLHLKNIDSENN